MSGQNDGQTSGRSDRAEGERERAAAPGPDYSTAGPNLTTGLTADPPAGQEAPGGGAGGWRVVGTVVGGRDLPKLGHTSLPSPLVCISVLDSRFSSPALLRLSPNHTALLMSCSTAL